jgi:hypothetical protein
LHIFISTADNLPGTLLLALLLVTAKLEVLAALDVDLVLLLALLALKTEHNLLGGLGLLVEDGLGLTTETGLLPVVTALALSEARYILFLKLINDHHQVFGITHSFI